MSRALKPPRVAKKKTAVAPKRRGYGGKTADDLAVERRTRLLQAGIVLFSSRGYARTPVEALCAEAKVTTRHFYEVFASREALLVALYEEVVGAARRAVIAALEQPPTDFSERIQRVVSAFVQSYLADARCTRICVLEAVGVSEALERRRREVIHEFAQIVKAYAEQTVRMADGKPRDFHLLSVALVGGVNELLVEWLIVEKPPSREQLIEVITELFKSLLR